jgi:hypothetical protein
VEYEIKGIPSGRAKPFAADAPILRPVYEPGPPANATAEISFTADFDFPNVFSMHLLIRRCKYSE